MERTTLAQYFSGGEIVQLECGLTSLAQFSPSMLVPLTVHRVSATRYLEEHPHKRSLERDARSLTALDAYIGALTLQQVHFGSLQTYIRDKLKAGKSPGTVNRDLAVVRRILNLCARFWRDEEDRPWLDTAPLIQMQRHPDKRTPYPLSTEEQRLLFSELTAHLARMALFKVNTGTREHEVCGLRWSWEVRVPELDTSVFIIRKRPSITP
jgi:integrase